MKKMLQDFKKFYSEQPKEIVLFISQTYNIKIPMIFNQKMNK
jgi:hypothetical protein